MATTHILGFPRIGARRELKFALEGFWKGALDEAALLATGRDLRRKHWDLQRASGLDYVTAGDFAWYDHVLTTLAHLGCLPERFGFAADKLTLSQYFALARGSADQPAMEITKWFDTNYHYLVPEWGSSIREKPGVDWLFQEVREAQADGHAVKAVIVGPLTLLHLGKTVNPATNKLKLLPVLVSAYARLLGRLKTVGVAWVQIDEPVLCLELAPDWLDAFPPIYRALAQSAPDILLATYFESVAEHHVLLKSLPVSGLHLDLVQGAGQLDTFLTDYPPAKVLSLGVVNGRNVWRTDLSRALALLERARARLGPRAWISASCSLMHVPVDLSHERKLDGELAGRLAFATQKLEEIATLKRGLTLGREAIGAALAQSDRASELRHSSACIRLPAVQSRLSTVTEKDYSRNSPCAIRVREQEARLRLPLLPTTTIGSFPQTAAIRETRAAWRRGDLSESGYVAAMQAEIADAIARQDRLGLDVLVHGEFERNDMVEYFAEHLGGFAVTQNGWVQSYGSRCVKPPIIYGDVCRPEPMTLSWIKYARRLTAKPVKGMLTGPMTMLQWSFARDDQPRATTAMQIALALRDEVQDLERTGTAVIQIDEPAFREGLPLKKRDWPRYLDWAVRAFRLAAAGVADDTQIHTHMCYSEFSDILPDIARMDADVITIETARSNMELLDGFGAFRYPNDIGPGLYDIHSPRIPSVDEMLRLLERALRLIPAERLWVNPDCGLKTRGWPEVEAALANMVKAAATVRARAVR